MKKTFLACIILLALSSSLLFAQTDEELCIADLKMANETPRIELDYQVVLSTTMKKALKEVEPDFKPWPLSHFYPYVRSIYKFSDERSKNLRRAYQSPAAVIGDFNGDNRNDIVMDGYDKTHKIEVVLLSKGEKYEVTVTTKNAYNKLPEDFDPYKPVCYFDYIELVEKGTKIKSGTEKEPLILKNDGYKYQGDKTSGIEYYLNGKWYEYVTGD